MLSIKNVNTIGARRRGVSLFFSSSLQAKIAYLWIGAYNGDDLKSEIGNLNITTTGKDFSTTYIPVDSVATFRIPVEFAGADTDGLWTLAGVPQEVSVADLIADDYASTFVKYDGEAPHHVRAIAILKAGEGLTSTDRDELTEYFQLYYLYFDEWNDLGYGKENRE
jgi:hypothetical protein